MEPTNYYEDKTNRQFLNENKKTTKQKLEQAVEKPEKWKETAKDVGTDLIVGVLGGGLVAAAIGKPALLVGIVVSGYGHYAQNKIISALGLGMMASSTMSALNGQSQATTITDRLSAFQEELKRKFFLDKLSPTKKLGLSGINSTPTQTAVVVPPKASDFIINENAEKQTTKGNEELNSPRIEDDKDFEWDFNKRIY